MNLLLVFATPRECSVIEPFFKPDRISDSGFVWGCHEVNLLVTGVGMVASSLSIASELASNRPDLVVHAGISGSYHHSLAVGQPVWIEAECFPEMGKEVDGGFLTLDQMGFGLGQIPFHNNSINNPFTAHRFVASWPVVKGATVNTITTKANRGDAIHHRFGALTESMEGGAVLAGCMGAQVDCLQLRVVSNYCLPSPDDRWNLTLALEKLGSALHQALAKL